MSRNSYHNRDKRPYRNNLSPLEKLANKVNWQERQQGKKDVKTCTSRSYPVRTKSSNARVDTISDYKQ